MLNTIYQNWDLHQAVTDASLLMSQVTPDKALCILAGAAAAVYLVTRTKAALIIAMSAVIYALPVLLAGHMH